jgi:hypothetical protein
MDSEWNVFKQVEDGAWQYHVDRVGADAVYEVSAADTDKLASGLGVDPGAIEKAWLERFGTGERQVALQWFKENDILLTTRFAWIDTDWND